MNNPQRNAVGDQIVPSANPRRRKKNKTRYNSKKISTKPKLQKPQARIPNTLNLNMTRAKQQWEDRNGKVEFQIQP